MLILWVVHAAAGRSLAAVPEQAAGGTVDAVAAVWTTGGLMAQSGVVAEMCTEAAVGQTARAGGGVGL